jgi:hypothetical protein
MTSVHLVGSVGLDTVPEVFAAAGKYLGPFLKRVPDGETGGRRLWVSWQYPLLRASPFLQAEPAPSNSGVGFPVMRVADGVRQCGLAELLRVPITFSQPQPWASNGPMA